MAVLRRRPREEDVRYLRRSPAAKRHIHSKCLLLLLLLLLTHPCLDYPFLPAPLHVPSISHLLLVSSWSSLFPSSMKWPYCPSCVTCDPRRLSRMAEYVCQVETAVNLSSNASRKKNNVFACSHFPRVHLTQSDKTTKHPRLLNHIGNVDIFLREPFANGRFCDCH